MYAYSVYGLSLQSDLPIPELLSCEGDRVPTDADVVVRHGSLPPLPNHEGGSAEATVARPSADPDEAFDSWAERWPERDEMLCVFAGVGRFLVRAGHSILVEPAPDADPGVVRHLLLGPVLAHLLWQRGVFTLHASVAGVRGHYVAFVGASGEGKSTTAAAFAAGGQALVCDDVAALVLEDDSREPTGVRVLPGFPRLRLYADSVRGLGEDPGRFAPVHALIDKHSKPIAAFAAAPVALERLYVLASGEEFALEPLPARIALMEVLRHTYYAHQFAPLYGFQKHLEQAARVVERVPAFRLTRPKDLARLRELVAFVEARS